MGLVQEKIYKKLHEHYKRAFISLHDAVKTVGVFGEKEDKLKLIETVTNGDTTKFISYEDADLVNLLEYLLDDKEPVR